MGRELEDFRMNLERLNTLYPDKEMLTVEDVKKIYGISNYRYLDVEFIGTKRRKLVSKVSLARQMSGGT